MAFQMEERAYTRKDRGCQQNGRLRGRLKLYKFHEIHDSHSKKLNKLQAGKTRQTHTGIHYNQTVERQRKNHESSKKETCHI